ncbi:portal protein [Sinorhizobium meliloti]|uniref:portal protein n=1 Tax=Rhizobium meliloti TaxID=382 RepID=UPI000FD8F7FB|nr:portal protein [Sinorhizobium meliloti]RVM26264.1 portal protein [Sinorhizobium meliloti]
MAISKKDERTILETIGTKLKDSVNFSNGNIAQKQEKALKYYNRELLDGDSKLPRGRSKWVSPLVQNHVDWATGQLIRIFTTPEHVCEFQAIGPEDEAIARQQTAVVNWILTDKNKHLSYLHPWLQNGFLTGLGIVTAEFETITEESLPRLIKGIPDVQLVQFSEQQEAGQIIIEESGEPYTIPGGVQVRDVKIRTVTRRSCINVFPVDPEDAVLSTDAQFDPETGGIRAKLQGHRKIMSRSVLIDLGFDKATVDRIPGVNEKTDGIALERLKDVSGERAFDKDMVEVYTVYTRLKLDTTSRHYRITFGGASANPILLDYEETTRFYPYAAFVPYPLAGTLFGQGIADRIGEDHEKISKMERAVQDSLNMSVFPITVVDDDVSSIDDLTNLHPGKVIRSSSPNGGINFVQHPFTGAQATGIIERLEQKLDFSTGVGPQMMTLDASDLQRTTATAINQRSNQQQTLIETVSRFFAETGYRYLTKVIVDLLVQKPDESQELIGRLTGNFIPVDEYNINFDVTTSVAFGVMSRDQSMASLNNLLAQQYQALAQGLPIVNAQNIFNTVAKLTELSGYKNTAAHWTDPTTLPPPPPPQPPVDPNAGIIEVETVKAQLKSQSDELNRQSDLTKFAAEMDFKRDQLAQELELKRAEIEAKYAAQVAIEQLKLEQRMPRDPMGNIQ